ncbi:MAG: immune inhibitor A [Planctomycetes bacterium]|nr:immune inhibitor A [Planctomycetota bacterium]
MKQLSIHWTTGARPMALALLMGVALTATARAQIAPPYAEDFESEATCATSAASPCPLFTTGWTNSAADNMDWIVDFGGTPSSATGPSVDHAPGTATGNYLYTESSSTGAPNRIAILESPRLDAFSVPFPQVSFWYHMFGAGQGTMHVDLREIFNEGTDGNLSGTTFTATGSSNFTAAHLGSTIVISGSIAGNDGVYTITSMNAFNSVEVAPAFVAAESMVAFTHQIETLDVIPFFTDNINQWQKKSLLLDTAMIRGGATEQFQVLIRGITGIDFTSDMAVDDFAYASAQTNDVGVVSIESPTAYGCLGDTTVTVTLENFGLVAQSNIPVGFALDGGSTTMETFAGTINPGQQASYSFSAPMTVAVLGPHTLTVSTALATDTGLTNDASSKSFSTQPSITSYPYLEDFEGGPSVWTSDGPANSWGFGTPAKLTINSAASGTNCWISGGTALPYPNSEQSFVIGPCFDLSNLTSAMFSMNIWVDCESDWDGAALQSSIDAGVSWQSVGGLLDTPNWFNDPSIDAAPGGQILGWSGSTGGWVNASHILTGLAGQPQVMIRVAFASDGSTVADGFAFDDVMVVDLGQGPYPGSLEDIDMATGVNGPATSGPTQYIKQTVFADIVTIAIISPNGGYTGSPYVLFGQLFSTGSPPFPIDAVNFPEVHFNLGGFQVTPVMPLAPIIGPNGSSSNYLTPGPALSGTSILLQGLVVDNMANNGFFAITNGYEFQIL